MVIADQNKMFEILRCPVTRSKLQLEVIDTFQKKFSNGDAEMVNNGILRADEDWFYPIINGIPRLIVEAFIDFAPFFKQYMSDYEARRENLLKKYPGLICYVQKKNRRTKESFSQEWNVFNYEEDKTWHAGHEGMLDRFLKETDETTESIKGKLIFDAGCGNGLLNQFIAKSGAVIIGMDFSVSIERAFEKNEEPDAFFIQGDVQFPPVSFEVFDIVHSSGVLICTNNTELSFSCLSPCVKKGGKLSVWLYHPRKNFIHNLFNFIRGFTSKLPARVQYYLYSFTLLPLSYIIKRIKGNKQNKREMMIDILDWFSPQYRWEHTHDETASWFAKRDFENTKITTDELFGFNITGVKKR